MNDLFALHLKADVISFADDTSLLYSALTKEDVLNEYEHDQSILLPWFKENMMHLNINKCKFMIYAYKCPDWAEDFKIEMESTKIEKVANIKYFGVVIDEKLTWQKHSEHLQKKLRKQNYIFYHLKNYLNSWQLQKLYSPLYESILNYGIIHWGGSAHIQPLKVLQNKVCRMILSMGRRTWEAEIYHKMNKLKLENVYKTRLLMLLLLLLLFRMFRAFISYFNIQ